MKKTNNSINNNSELKDENGNTIDINPEPHRLEDETLVDKKTLKKYRVHWYQRIPYPVRALFIKYWFFGLNYFLFMMGLGSIPYFRESAESIFATVTLVLFTVSGFALGAFNDLFVYNILDVIEDFPGQKKRFVFFKSKKIYSLFINIAYGIVLGIGSLLLCGFLNTLIPGNTFWFREPFSAALVMFLVDLAVVEFKNMCVHFYRQITHKDEEEFEDIQ